MTKVRDQDKFMVRLPDGMREKISADAKAKGRSMNAEIVARIANSAPEKTLRDEVAISIANGLFSSPRVVISLERKAKAKGVKVSVCAAEFSYKMADAMLRAREVQHD